MATSVDSGRERVLALARRRSYQQGEAVVRQGDEARSLYVVESGRVTVRFTTPQGDSVILGVMGQGAVFGELGMIVARHERTATIVAIDAVSAWVLRQEDFERVRRSSPDVNDFLMVAMARQVERLTTRVAEMLYIPVERRVARRLYELARLFGDGGSAAVRVPLTQEEIAQLAGTTRPTANQALKRLESEGALRVMRGGVDLLDLAAIRRHGAW